MSNSAFLLRSSLVTLFSLKALRSPVALQKLLHCFSAAYALKIQRKIFTAASPDAPLTASAAALKLKIALKSWSLVFTAATTKPKGQRKPRIPKPVSL
ncbi:hypothetical protein [Campylobacter sp.]|uniref:hypothetical protein n=1 Tax=Campylobacter sp. TaxID=205 RepID=UPI002AA737D5|nr:hypothetical protein [Campylobacter sp.]MCI7236584.1 hypothetical protein [Campylobacter sp.]